MLLPFHRRHQATTTTPQVAEKLGITRQRVLALIDVGRLPAIMVGGSYIVKEADLKLIENRPVGRPPKPGGKADALATNKKQRVKAKGKK